MSQSRNDDKVHILGIAGSLRKGSFNRATLRAAKEICPDTAEIEIFEIDNIPPFNQDNEQNPPDKVKQLKERIRAADAVLFVTPEYNYSVSGVLKNAIDWASRPHGDNAWDDKPAGIMGASIGMIGSARAQYDLRESMVYLNMHPINGPEVMIPNATENFDDNGRLKDETARNFIREHLDALVEWTRRLQGAPHRVGVSEKR